MINIKLKTLLQVLTSVSFLALLFAAVMYQNHTQVLPITTVQVIAPLRFVTENEIKDAILNTDITNKGFFNIDMQKIKDLLGNNPWLYDINLTRVWPDKLRIAF